MRQAPAVAVADGDALLFQFEQGKRLVAATVQAQQDGDSKTP